MKKVFMGLLFSSLGLFASNPDHAGASKVIIGDEIVLQELKTKYVKEENKDVKITFYCNLNDQYVVATIEDIGVEAEGYHYVSDSNERIKCSRFKQWYKETLSEFGD